MVAKPKALRRKLWLAAAVLLVGTVFVWLAYEPLGTDSPKAEPLVSPGSGPGDIPISLPKDVRPSLDQLHEDIPIVLINGCYGATLKVCSGGDPDGELSVVLAGDSHAGQWWPAVDAAAKRFHWRLYVVGKSGCPLVSVEMTAGSGTDSWFECMKWQEEAADAVVALDADLVIFAAYAQGYKSRTASLRDNFFEKWTTGADVTLARFAEVSDVLVLGQLPVFPEDTLECLSENRSDVRACSLARDVAIDPAITSMNTKLAEKHGAKYFDLGDVFCTPHICPVIADGMIIYRDGYHLTDTFAAARTELMAGIIGGILRAG